jgi:hypothetical protein
LKELMGLAPILISAREHRAISDKAMVKVSLNVLNMDLCHPEPMAKDLWLSYLRGFFAIAQNDKKTY